ncbi:vesicle coat component [Scheffersomyces spartinae]|uniref:Vesicle coat component n=1 Tax=Scheffersomyces spartinae TaxID=45513 RepID=A0A9P7VB15_9ASCO|nr:vesicle coat component [Scheffersomyces spartinae]KAG7194572.1 vesicle coat component [Scheffersomyces spartinae]
MRHVIFTLVAAFLWALVSGLHLEIPASHHPEATCIRDFAQDGLLVVVNLQIDGNPGDGQQLDLVIVDSMGFEYRRTKDIKDKVRIAFTSHDAAFDVCFTNTLNSRFRGESYVRHVELDIESGAAARDWNALQTANKLKPAEVELKRIEEVTNEIHEQLTYLKVREERMRDTNESTNARVKWFSIVVVFSLIGFGLWQLAYLRNYFRTKHII